MVRRQTDDTQIHAYLIQSHTSGIVMVLQCESEIKLISNHTVPHDHVRPSGSAWYGFLRNYHIISAVVFPLSFDIRLPQSVQAAHYREIGGTAKA
jgi:hypothetical protein